MASVGRELAVRGTAAVTSRVVGFWRGFTFPFRGAKFVYQQHPKLIRFWGVPILITLLVLSTVVGVSVSYSDDLVNALWAAPTGSGVGAMLGRIAHFVLELLTMVLLVGVGAVLVALISSVFAAPFNDSLSEAVEQIASGVEMPRLTFGMQLKSAIRGVAGETAKLALYGSVMAPLFVVSLLVPGAGEIAYTIVGYWLTAVYFAIDYVDWPAARRNQGFRFRLSMVRRHGPAMLGFGCGVWLFLIIPFVNLFFMPAAVAGGTLLFLELEGPSSARP